MAEKKVTLKSSDGVLFEVDGVVAMQFQKIKHMIKNDSADIVIPLPIVNSKILTEVIEYCKKHVDAPNPKDGRALADELKIWDAEFVKVNEATLLDLATAAKYLEVESLMELTCKAVADIIKVKSVEEIRKTFNIKNDFTPEEEEQFRW